MTGCRLNTGIRIGFKVLDSCMRICGATFRDCDLSKIKIAGSILTDFRISGRIDSVIVEDVDVTAFVMAELGRRYPERVQLREARTAADYRAMWATTERLWSQTLQRAELLPEAARHQRVDAEWSFVETLRHLVFATDVWVGRMIRGDAMPYHRSGLPPTDYPASGAPDLGVDLDAEPSYPDAVAMFADRMAQVREAVDALTDSELDEVRTNVPAPLWGEESHTVAQCLRVVVNEHCEHRRFAERDLAVLEGS